MPSITNPTVPKHFETAKSMDNDKLEMYRTGTIFGGVVLTLGAISAVITSIMFLAFLCSVGAAYFFMFPSRKWNKVYDLKQHIPEYIVTTHDSVSSSPLMLIRSEVVNSWNEYLRALELMDDEQKHLVAVDQATFHQECWDVVHKTAILAELSTFQIKGDTADEARNVIEDLRDRAKAIAQIAVNTGDAAVTISLGETFTGATERIGRLLEQSNAQVSTLRALEAGPGWHKGE